MQEIIVMAEETAFWGKPRWQVYEVPERGTIGPVKGSPPAATKEQALIMHRMACEHSFTDPERAPLGRVYLLILSPNWGPTERWLKANWF